MLDQLVGTYKLINTTRTILETGQAVVEDHLRNLR